MAARQRALDRGYRGSRPPQPRDQSLHRSKRRYFQYAVRSPHAYALTNPSLCPQRRDAHCSY